MSEQLFNINKISTIGNTEDKTKAININTVKAESDSKDDKNNTKNTESNTKSVPDNTKSVPDNTKSVPDNTKSVKTYTGIVKAGALNIRANPDINSLVIGRLNHGDKVIISDLHGDFGKLYNRDGWVMLKYLKI